MVITQKDTFKILKLAKEFIFNGNTKCNTMLFYY